MEQETKESTKKVRVFKGVCPVELLEQQGRIWYVRALATTIIQKKDKYARRTCPCMQKIRRGEIFATDVRYLHYIIKDVLGEAKLLRLVGDSDLCVGKGF